MRTILVIEDDTGVRDNIQDLLSSVDYNVIGASDGREGLQVARTSHPDLIICDVMMPDVDGYEVLRQLRGESDTVTIPFIFVTAKAGREDLRAGMDLGADDYLIKPFTANELLSAVNTRLERHDEQSHWYEERMDELRSNLSRTLPHELRTPLSCILGYSEFLLEVYESVEPDELHAMLEEINISGKRLERLIENYHLYAQLEIAATDPAWRAAMLSQGLSRPELVVGQVAKVLAERHQRTNDLYLRIQPAVVRIQDVYLDKVVEELIDNAFKFSKPGAAVQVTGQQEEEFYMIVVEDNGRGMEADQLGQLGAFVQHDRKRYEQQGLGLGLTIARRLVELHHGVLEVESIPDEGTTVWVTLPAFDEQTDGVA